jgi:hypothetical protein
MFCQPSRTDKILTAARELRIPPDLYPDSGGLGAVDWNSFVQAIPGVLNTATQVYGNIEAGKYNPYASFNLPYGVTPSVAGVSWSGSINPATQGLPVQQAQSYLPYLLIGGAALAVLLLMRR